MSANEGDYVVRIWSPAHQCDHCNGTYLGFRQHKVTLNLDGHFADEDQMKVSVESLEYLLASGDREDLYMCENECETSTPGSMYNLRYVYRCVCGSLNWGLTEAQECCDKDYDEDDESRDVIFEKVDAYRHQVVDDEQLKKIMDMAKLVAYAEAKDESPNAETAEVKAESESDSVTLQDWEKELLDEAARPMPEVPIPKIVEKTNETPVIKSRVTREDLMSG